MRVESCATVDLPHQNPADSGWRQLLPAWLADRSRNPRREPAMRSDVDLSYALIWMVGSSALFGLWSAVQQWRIGIRGWFYKHLCILAVLGLGVYLDWQPIGYVALVLWLALVMVPNHANRRVVAAMHRHDLEQALRWARVHLIFHPFDGQIDQTRFLSSQCHFEAGRIAEAKGELYPLLGSANWSERVKLELLHLDGRWFEIAEHAKSRAVGSRDLALARLYLQAFGEIGDVQSMWQMYAEVPAPIAAQPALRIQMASYSGLVDELERLFARHLPELPEQYRQHVRAIGLLCAGRTIEGKRLLANLAQAGGSGSARASAKLTQLPRAVDLGALPTHLQLVLANFRRAIQVEAVTVRQLPRTARVWATPTLLSVLTVVYLVGLPGGSTDPENLVRMGALVLPKQLAEGGIAWRILAAGFLHLGATHLLMNCLGLWVLGKQIEQLWGGLAMLGLFLASSVGSFGFAALFVAATVADPRVFLGASSGVLGLVGALGSYLATGYLLHRREAIGRRFMLVVAVVAAQLVFDALTPIVSSMLHLTGLAFGALLAVPLSLHTWRNGSLRRRTL